MKSYWENFARPGAKHALAEAGLASTSISPHTGLHHIFDTEDRKYTATPLQQFAEMVDLPHGRLLFIIEDMTGAGKTEAAVTSRIG